MSDHDRPDYEFENEDLRVLARVLAAMGSSLSGELQKVHQAIDRNTRALDELKNTRKSLDRNSRAIEEAGEQLRSAVNDQGGQLHDALRFINHTMAVYLQSMAREDKDAQ